LKFPKERRKENRKIFEESMYEVYPTLIETISPHMQAAQ
jgi:hypothetical protein